MASLESDRQRMLEAHLKKRRIRDERVLAAFAGVRRDDFVAEELREFSYEDAPLPIGEGQTISQPYIVAVTVEALNLKPGERVLDVGTGSGYAAAIMSRLAGEIFSIERIPSLADTARERLARLRFDNVHVRTGDGSLGWPEHAPFDAIAVGAGGPRVPEALREQLAIGGRLVIPVGDDDSSQTLRKVTRKSAREFVEETLADVRFVPLIGAQAWEVDDAHREKQSRRPKPPADVVELVKRSAEPIVDIDGGSVDAMIERIGGARLVLMGEATHGTSEFYRMRARLTKELIEKRGFRFVAVEADWPDAARVDDYVLGGPARSKLSITPFARFPRWMWRNQEVVHFVEWLRSFNASLGDSEAKTGFHGLDLYSMFTSIASVLEFLDGVDVDAGRVARARYGTLTRWQKDPAAYGKAVLVGRYESSEREVVAILRDLLDKRIEYARVGRDRFFDAAQNARLVASAERYYRAMYYGSIESWNLRDAHMFDTLESLFAFYGPGAKGVVWEHNSHVGDASATEMGARGEHNVGQLARLKFGRDAYIVGFGTDHGTVAAASDWDEPVERMGVRPAHHQSYERVFHDTGIEAFTTPLRHPGHPSLREQLIAPRLERAIGVVYRPESEFLSHYFQASLPAQFDEYVWFDETRAVAFLDHDVLSTAPRGVEGERPPAVEIPDTYPFGL